MIPPVGTTRTDRVFRAAEDVKAFQMLRSVRRPKNGVKVYTKRGQPNLVGMAVADAAKGERVWVRSGYAEVEFLDG